MASAGYEMVVNDASGVVTSGGTTAPAAGTSETWTVSPTVAFPAVSSTAPATQFVIADATLGSQFEKCLVTSCPGGTAAGQSWTVIRGYDGTTPIAHSSGFTVQQVLTAGSIAQIRSPFLNARTMFGAVGNGSTDDTAALTAWINAANAFVSGLGAGMGVTLYLPAGEYMIASPLPTITSDCVTILGEGWAYNGAVSHHGSCIVANASYVSSTAMLVFTGTGCRLLNLSVDGGGFASTVINVNGDHCQLAFIQARNPTTSGICLNIGSTGASAWITDSVFNGVTPGTVIGILIGSHDVLFQNNKVDNTNICLEINGSGGGAQIQNNHFTPGSAGTNAIWINGSVNDIMITGNRFDNGGGSCIQITCGTSSMHDVQIVANQFQNQTFSATTSYAWVAVDTTNHSVNSLQVNNNIGYGSAGNLAGWFLAALTQAGVASAGPTKIGSAGSQASGNIAYVTNSSFWATSSSPTQARGNLVTTDGATYSSVTDI